MLRAVWMFLMWFVNLRSVRGFKLGQAFQVNRSTDIAQGFGRRGYNTAGQPPGHRARVGQPVCRGDDTALYSTIQSQTTAVNESFLSEAIVNKLFSSTKDSLDYKSMTLLITRGSSAYPFSTHTYQEPEKPCESWAKTIVKGRMNDAKEHTIWAILAGIGGGRTTFLYELTKALNRREDTVAIGISFGDRWDSTTLLEPLVLQEGDKKAESDAEALVGVAVRMWSMIANVPFPEAVSSFRTMIREVSASHNMHDVSALSVSFAQQLLARMIVSYVELQRSKHGKPGVKRFVLLMDDVDKGEDMHYAPEERMEGNVTVRPEEHTEGNVTVRPHGLQPIVTRTIVPSRSKEGGDIAVSKLFRASGLRGRLVLSPFTKAMLNESKSGHQEFSLISLQRSLDPETVVKEWLPMYVSKDWENVYEKDIRAALTAELIISMAAQVPGMVAAMMPSFRGKRSSSNPQVETKE